MNIGMDKGFEALRKGLASLYESEHMTDLTVICGPYRFNVHQAVLATQTSYFQKIANFKEGESSTITLKTIGGEDEDDEDDTQACDDPDAIKCMIYYIYHLEYDLMGKPILLSAQEDSLLLHAKVFSAAVKYQIPALRYLSVMKFAAEVRVNWSRATFATAVHHIYTTTPEDARELRDIVTKIITSRPQLFHKQELKSVVMDISGLAWELLRTSKGLTAAMPEKNPLDFCCFHCGTERVLQGCNCMRVCLNCRPKSCPFC